MVTQSYDLAVHRQVARVVLCLGVVASGTAGCGDAAPPEGAVSSPDPGSLPQGGGQVDDVYLLEPYPGPPPVPSDIELTVGSLEQECTHPHAVSGWAGVPCHVVTITWQGVEDERIVYSIVPYPWDDPASYDLSTLPMGPAQYPDGGSSHRASFAARPDVEACLEIGAQTSDRVESSMRVRACVAVTDGATAIGAPAVDGSPEDGSPVPSTAPVTTTTQAPTAPPGEFPPRMLVGPATAHLGDVVELVYPAEVERASTFLLHRWDGAAWSPPLYALTADSNATCPDCMSTEPYDEQIRTYTPVTGAGPDRVRLPDDAPPGRYRICTVGAPEELCAQLTVDPVAADPGPLGGYSGPVTTTDSARLASAELLGREVTIGFVPEQFAGYSPVVEDYGDPFGRPTASLVLAPPELPRQPRLAVSITVGDGIGEHVANGRSIDGFPFGELVAPPYAAGLTVGDGAVVWESVDPIHGAQRGFTWAYDRDTVVYVGLPAAYDQTSTHRVLAGLRVR
jgi:hypothetical protein